MNEFLRIKSREYTTIPNHFLRDKSLSCKAKGVLSMILALPDDWDFSVKGMVSIIKDGESALRSAITELRNQGYCVMSRPKENGKYTKVVYVFSGEPITEEDVRGYIEQSEKKEEAEEPQPTEQPQDDFPCFLSLMIDLAASTIIMATINNTTSVPIFIYIPPSAIDR